MKENNYSAVTVRLSGRIDSGNAAQTEQLMLEQLKDSDNGSAVILDAEDLAYISSAGLRVVLRLKKSYPDLKIINVNPEVYEILEMTGFTEMMTVEKAYRVVSVEGCEVIGEGFNGKVYRIDKDNVVKTYKNADALAEIQHEREVARLALILGVPTAISYDVVRVGDSYGSVFELLNARSFSKILASEPERFDWCVAEYIKMLKAIHAIEVPAGKLPSIKRKTLTGISRMKDTVPDGLGDKLLAMAEAIPESDHMIHGDYHTKNIVLAGDEVLVIDMDTLSVGHPIFDLVRMYNAYVGYSEYDPDIVLSFQGYGADIARRFWHDSLAAYLHTKDEEKIKAVDEKVRCLSYGCLIDWSIRHTDPDSEKDKATRALWMTRLAEILKRTDSLDFEIPDTQKSDPDELDIEAATENLEKVMDFVNSHLDTVNCPAKARMQLDLAVEEIFVNIARYAYAPEKGNATIKVEVLNDPVTVTITFMDRGVPYDPLKKENPDVTLCAEEREIGGLGIFMTKKVMDDVYYEYRDGQNILTLKKVL
ncbi:MAG: anti-sigma factor antagonist [Oscillospiraceae bacterium]|nr:anti-sigma factor antagonist [Oscillospiraceae bacterium]